MKNLAKNLAVFNLENFENQTARIKSLLNVANLLWIKKTV